MNICGVLVHAHPESIDAVLASLKGREGIEVHQSTADGRIVVTLEDTATVCALDALSDLHRTPGVLAAALTYHHFSGTDRGAATN
jgi:periplasmic nitrate reductase NapD